MMKSTIKVAELATIFYAVLILMSLLIDTAYYSQFNIRIVSYMSITEILLSCLENFYLYAPSIIFVGVCLVLYLIYWINPKFRQIYYFSRLKTKTDINESTVGSRTNFYFGGNRSLHAKYSVVSKYNGWARMLPLMVIISSLYPYQSIVLNYTSGKVTLFVLFLVYMVLLFVFSDNFDKIENTYDWKGNPILEKKYICDPIRKKIAAYHFSLQEKVIIEYNYRYRHAIVCVIFFISLFIALCLAMFYSAKEVIEKGNNQYVVLKCKDAIVDTRQQNLDYIGESAGFIFIYDRATRGTHVYERNSLESYMIVKESILPNADANLVENDDEMPIYSSRVNNAISEGLCNKMTTEINEFFVDYNALQYRLIDHQLNHYVWYDTINNTYLEQIAIPRALFDQLPSDNEIFMLESYVKDEDRTKKYEKTAVKSTYQGPKGEKIMTMVCRGMDYCAWLFYDESGINVQYGDQILNSINSKYTPWQQFKIQYLNKNALEKVLMICCLGFVIVLCSIVGFFAARGIRKKDDKEYSKKEYISVLVAPVLFSMILIFYIENQEIPFGEASITITLYFLVINCAFMGMGYMLGHFFKNRQNNKLKTI